MNELYVADVYNKQGRTTDHKFVIFAQEAGSGS